MLDKAQPFGRTVEEQPKEKVRDAVEALEAIIKAMGSAELKKATKPILTKLNQDTKAIVPSPLPGPYWGDPLVQNRFGESHNGTLGLSGSSGTWGKPGFSGLLGAKATQSAAPNAGGFHSPFPQGSQGFNTIKKSEGTTKPFNSDNTVAPSSGAA
jgi:hypothetical protein